MKKFFKTPFKTGKTSSRFTRLLLLLLMTGGSLTTYAQTIGIIQGLTAVTLKQGPPFNGGPTVEFPVIIPGSGEVYANRFYKFDNSGNLVDIGTYPATTNGSQVCYGTACYFGYCVNCTVSDFPQIYRAVTLNCNPGSVGSWKPDPYSDPAMGVSTNNCTASEAWSNPLTWYDYKVPNPATGGFNINRNVTLDVNYDATNKAIYCSNSSALTINSGVTLTSVNSTAGRFVNNGVLNGAGQFAGVVNNGIVSPGGNGIAQFQGAGPYTQNASGTLNMQLASTNSFDKLYWTSGANVLGGTLKVSFLNGFVPVANNSFNIIEMSYATYTGTFSNLVLPALATGLKWKIHYNSNSVSLTVVDCSQFSATYSKSDTGCYGSMVGSILATPVNGTAPYMYKLNSGAYGSSNQFNNLKAGNYKVYIIDDNGCTTISPTIAITTHAAVTGTATASAVCHDSMGSMIVTPGGGTAPFKYRLGTTGNFGPSNTFSVKAGTNTVYIMDAYGCTGSAKASFTNPVAITATTSSTTVSPCSNSTNGSITITSTSGVSPYLYKKKVTDTYGTANTFSGLAAGTYKVYMKDANSCEIIKSVVVTSPPAVIVSYTPVNPSCTNGRDGSITLGALQSPNATFKLYPGSSVYTSQYVYGSLPGGTYYGYAKDTFGCIGRTPAIVLSAGTGCRNSFPEGKMRTTNETGINELSVSLSPNPSSSVFKLTTHTAKAEAIQLRVIDINGKVVYTAKGSPTQAFTFGEALTNGVYLIEVRQGNEVKTLKAIKN